AAAIPPGNRTVTISWDAVGGAGTTYRVYRLDPKTGAYALVTGAGALSATSFTDTGLAVDPTGAAPRAEVRSLPPGSLSTWSAAVPQLKTAREGTDGVVVRMDGSASTDLVARIIVAG